MLLDWDILDTYTRFASWLQEYGKYQLNFKIAENDRRLFFDNVWDFGNFVENLIRSFYMQLSS